MNTFDNYGKITGELMTISKNALKSIRIPILQKLLLQNAKENGTITDILIHETFPDLISKKIMSEFDNINFDSKDCYAIFVGEITEIYTKSKSGAYYGINALKRLANNNQLKCGIIFNTPEQEFRGLKAYLPARSDIDFFKNTVDLCGYLGFNKLVLEVGGAMEYERHPEINDGWEQYCSQFSEYQGKSLDVQRSFGWSKNSIHCENGGGSFLTKKEVAQLISYCNERYIEVIPEVPCLSHCDYLLTAHHELAERKEDPIPDTYCPNNPESYRLLFDVLDEIIDVFSPNIVHIGHDEYFSCGLCETCKEEEPAVLYANDIIKIYNYLSNKGIKTMMWAEKLLQAFDNFQNPLGGLAHYDSPETYKAIDMLPKDIIMMHWYWEVSAKCEDQLYKAGFPVIFGNFKPTDIQYWGVRKAKGLKGVCISNWSAFNEPHMQRNHIFVYLAYSAMMLWNRKFDEDAFESNLFACFSELYFYKNAATLSASHVEITHATTALIEHKPFVDGYTINEEADTLGYYLLSFENGKCERIPVIYGLNIGNSDLSWERTDSNNYDTKFPNEHLLEPSATCLYERNGEKTQYKFAIAIEEKSKLISVEFIKREGLTDDVFLYKVKLL